MLGRAVTLALTLAAGCTGDDGRSDGGSGLTSASASAGSTSTGSASASMSASASVSASASMSGSTDGGETEGSTSASTDATSTGSTSAASTTGGGTSPIDCEADPNDPACACDTMVNGEYTAPVCTPSCVDHRWRYALWVTSYNVSGTLGYGEHQGIALLATHYRYDPRFPSEDGVDPPWRVGGALWAVGDAIAEDAQFRARTAAPGGEAYVDAVELPGDSDDLFTGESLPQVPVLMPHPQIDAAALCDAPELVVDRRFYNHGRTLAERVPNHEWDSFFWRRGLIPLHQLAAFEVGLTHTQEPSGVGTDEAVRLCLDVLRDGFCDARCGNCSYVLSTGFGVPLSSVPANQIVDIPKGTQGPYQIGVDDLLVDARDNFGRLEDGRQVWYVGGSSWGRAAQVADYGPGEWPDPDLVSADPGSFLSVVGPISQGEPIPSQYEDAFTHCVDPTAWFSSQSPILSTAMISGRWGHNSNSDAEAALRQFLDCGADPVAAVDPAHWNQSACVACGEPRWEAGGPAQAPCQDLTHTAWSYWEQTPGIHNVDDLDLGRYDAVGPERAAVDRLSEVPDPICEWSGAPVFGM